jgi:hypothetical protein
MRFGTAFHLAESFCDTGRRKFEPSRYAQRLIDMDAAAQELLAAVVQTSES